MSRTWIRGEVLSVVGAGLHSAPSEQIVRDPEQGRLPVWLLPFYFFVTLAAVVSRVPRRFSVAGMDFRNMTEYCFENSEEFPELVWRPMMKAGQEAQGKFVRAVDGAGRGSMASSDEGTAVNSEFDGPIMRAPRRELSLMKGELGGKFFRISGAKFFGACERRALGEKLLFLVENFEGIRARTAQINGGPPPKVVCP